jgi:Tol biopolymer transport system component
VIRRIAIVLMLSAVLDDGVLPQKMVMFHYPRWSPDGKWLVLTTNVDGGDDEEVWVVSIDGAVRRRLTTNDVPDTAADWSRDGRTILLRREIRGQFEDWIMNGDGTNARRALAGDKPPTTGPLSVEERTTPGGQDVYARDRTAGTEYRMNAVAWAEQPALSPDGRLVVFEQRANPDDILHSDIAIWDTSTRSLRTIARGTDPSWSPDGRTLLFKQPQGPGNTLHIVTFDVARGQLSTIAPGVHPQYSPDGSRIVFMTVDGDRTDVQLVDRDGRNRRCVTCAWK